MAHWQHELSDYAARHAIPTVHEDTSGQGEGDIEMRRLAADLALERYSLERWAGPHPDGTAGTTENLAERGNARDSGYTIDRLEFLARSAGLTHPEVAARLARLAAWEGRLPAGFGAVREEYLSDRRAQSG